MAGVCGWGPAWQWACVKGAWQEACVTGECAWQEKQLLQQAVSILLKYILVKLSFCSRKASVAGGHAWHVWGGDVWLGMSYRGHVLQWGLADSTHPTGMHSCSQCDFVN